MLVHGARPQQAASCKLLNTKSSYHRFQTLTVQSVEKNE